MKPPRSPTRSPKPIRTIRRERSPPSRSRSSIGHSPASRPIRPNKPLNLALGALLGLVLGTVAGAARVALQARNGGRIWAPPPRSGGHPACRRGRHPAARTGARMLRAGHSAGQDARLYGRQDARRYAHGRQQCQGAPPVRPSPELYLVASASAPETGTTGESIPILAHRKYSTAPTTNASTGAAGTLTPRLGRMPTNKTGSPRDPARRIEARARTAPLLTV